MTLKIISFAEEQEKNVNIFIKKCQFKWIEISMSTENKNEIIAIIIVKYIRDKIKTFMQELLTTDIKNWNKLTETLKKQFSMKKKNNSVQAAMKKMFILQQRAWSLKKYLDEVEKVRQVLSNSLKSALIDNVMRDLISEIIYNMIIMQLTLRSADSSKIKIETVIQMIWAVIETKSKSVTEDENCE